MTTYKKLGLKMARVGEGKWAVKDSNGATLFEGTGNKGTVMHDCLHQVERFKLQGKHWVVNNEKM